MNRATDGLMGVSTDVLGYLVEVVSGMPFEEFLQTRLFGPLGMVDTAFSVPIEKLDRFAALYQLNKEGGTKGGKDKEKKTDGAKEKEKEMKGDKNAKVRLERVEKDPRLENNEIRFFPGGGGRTRLNGSRLYAVLSDVTQRRRT